jgi:predicted lipid-binding transport protein (Tim44 family)
VAGSDPGDRIPTTARPRARRLSEPPSARFDRRPPTGDGSDERLPGAASALRGPLIRASLAGAIGAVAIVTVGGVLASTFGLLLIGGITGTVVGLLVARAAVPDNTATPIPRRTVIRVAVAVALVGVALGDLGLWLFALTEGGVLGPIDYLWTTFGPFVPGVALVAVLTAWWGAGAGPVQR